MVYAAESLSSIGKQEGKGKQGKRVNLEDIAKDTGCAGISNSCLTCPLPWCIEEFPPVKRAQIRQRFLEFLEGKRQPG
jgi:hypothetical protein